MNILPKKKWHVRTKENVARVRRDQKLAAEEERRIKERAQFAEQQFKVNLLRKHADERMFTLYGTKRSETEISTGNVGLEGPSGHVNLFAELEKEDRKNFGMVNKEYEQEKRKEREDYESKVGILKYLGEGSNELTKQKSWYEQPSSRRTGHTSKEAKGITRVLPTGVMDFEETRKVDKKKRRRKKSDKKHKKKHRRVSDNGDEKSDRKRKRHRSYSSSEGSDGKRMRSNSSQRDDENERLRKLRLDRLQREETERKRTLNLLNPVREEDSGQRVTAKYSSQFNPELARQNRFR